MTTDPERYAGLFARIQHGAHPFLAALPPAIGELVVHDRERRLGEARRPRGPCLDLRMANHRRGHGKETEARRAPAEHMIDTTIFDRIGYPAAVDVTDGQNRALASVFKQLA